MSGENIIKEPASDVVVRFQDCDPFGHLNNARYLDYFINAREDHLAQYYDFDIYARQRKLQSNWVIVKTSIAYLLPVVFREKVVIRTCLLHFTENTLLMEGVMLDKDSKSVKSVVWITFMYFSLAEGKSIEHTDELMQLWHMISAGSKEIDVNDFDGRVKEIKSRF